MHQSGRIGDWNFSDSAVAIPRHVACSLSLGARISPLKTQVARNKYVLLSEEELRRPTRPDINKAKAKNEK